MMKTIERNIMKEENLPLADEKSTEIHTLEEGRRVR